MCRLEWTVVFLLAVAVSVVLAGRGPLTSACHNDADCVTKHAHCKTGFCECRLQFVPSQLRDTCLPVASKGGACNETEQCFSLGELGVCQQQKCGCAQGSEWDLQHEECVSSSGDRASQLHLTLAAALIAVYVCTQGLNKT